MRVVDVEEDNGSTKSDDGVFDVTTCLLKGHVITMQHEFCDVERSDGNQDNIVQISVTPQGSTLRLEMIM